MNAPTWAWLVLCMLLLVVDVDAGCPLVIDATTVCSSCIGTVPFLTIQSDNQFCLSAAVGISRIFGTLAVNPDSDFDVSLPNLQLVGDLEVNPLSSVSATFISLPSATVGDVTVVLSGNTDVTLAFPASTGDISIDLTSVPVSTTATFTLSQLTSAKSITIIGSLASTSILRFPDLVSVVGDISITNVLALEASFGSLTSIGGSLILSNTNDVVLGAFGVLSTVTAITLTNSPSATTLYFPELSVLTTLHLSDLSNMTNCDLRGWFPSLTDIQALLYLSALPAVSLSLAANVPSVQLENLFSLMDLYISSPVMPSIDFDQFPLLSTLNFTGVLSIDTPLAFTNFSALIVLQAPTALSIASLYISNCPSLMVVDFSSLASCRGSIELYDLPLINSLLSFPSLQTVNGSVSLSNLTSLTRLNFPLLQSIGGALDVSSLSEWFGGTYTVSAGFPSLQTVGISVQFRSCDSLVFVALPQLVAIGGTFNATTTVLSIVENAVLSRIGIMPNLQYLGGAILIVDNPLLCYPLQNLTLVDVVGSAQMNYSDIVTGNLNASTCISSAFSNLFQNVSTLTATLSNATLDTILALTGELAVATAATNQLSPTDVALAFGTIDVILSPAFNFSHIPQVQADLITTISNLLNPGAAASLRTAAANLAPGMTPFPLLIQQVTMSLVNVPSDGTCIPSTRSFSAPFWNGEAALALASNLTLSGSELIFFGRGDSSLSIEPDLITALPSTSTCSLFYAYSVEGDAIFVLAGQAAVEQTLASAVVAAGLVIDLPLMSEVHQLPPNQLVYYTVNVTVAQPQASAQLKCASYNIAGLSWTTDGCSVVSHNSTTITCACSHFTNFAAIWSTYSAIPDNIAVTAVSAFTVLFSMLTCLVLYVRSLAKSAQFQKQPLVYAQTTIYLLTAVADLVLITNFSHFTGSSCYAVGFILYLLLMVLMALYVCISMWIACLISSGKWCNWQFRSTVYLTMSYTATIIIVNTVLTYYFNGTPFGPIELVQDQVCFLVYTDSRIFGFIVPSVIQLVACFVINRVGLNWMRADQEKTERLRNPPRAKGRKRTPVPESVLIARQEALPLLKRNRGDPWPEEVRARRTAIYENDLHPFVAAVFALFRCGDPEPPHEDRTYETKGPGYKNLNTLERLAWNTYVQSAYEKDATTKYTYQLAICVHFVGGLANFPILPLLLASFHESTLYIYAVLSVTVNLCMLFSVFFYSTTTRLVLRNDLSIWYYRLLLQYETIKSMLMGLPLGVNRHRKLEELHFIVTFREAPPLQNFAKKSKYHNKFVQGTVPLSAMLAKAKNMVERYRKTPLPNRGGTVVKGPPLSANARKALSKSERLADRLVQQTIRIERRIAAIRSKAQMTHSQRRAARAARRATRLAALRVKSEAVQTAARAGKVRDKLNKAVRGNRPLDAKPVYLLNGYHSRFHAELVHLYFNMFPGGRSRMIMYQPEPQHLCGKPCPQVRSSRPGSLPLLPIPEVDELHMEFSPSPARRSPRQPPGPAILTQHHKDQSTFNTLSNPFAQTPEAPPAPPATQVCVIPLLSVRRREFHPRGAAHHHRHKFAPTLPRVTELPESEQGELQLVQILELEKTELHALEQTQSLAEQLELKLQQIDEQLVRLEQNHDRIQAEALEQQQRRVMGAVDADVDEHFVEQNVGPEPPVAVKQAKLIKALRSRAKNSKHYRLLLAKFTDQTPPLIPEVESDFTRRAALAWDLKRPFGSAAVIRDIDGAIINMPRLEKEHLAHAEYTNELQRIFSTARLEACELKRRDDLTLSVYNRHLAASNPQKFSRFVQSPAPLSEYERGVNALNYILLLAKARAAGGRRKQMKIPLSVSEEVNFDDASDEEFAAIAKLAGEYALTMKIQRRNKRILRIFGGLCRKIVFGSEPEPDKPVTAWPDSGHEAASLVSPTASGDSRCTKSPRYHRPAKHGRFVRSKDRRRVVDRLDRLAQTPLSRFAEMKDLEVMRKSVDSSKTWRFKKAKEIAHLASVEEEDELESAVGVSMSFPAYLQHRINSIQLRQAAFNSARSISDECRWRLTFLRFRSKFHRKCKNKKSLGPLVMLHTLQEVDEGPAASGAVLHLPPSDQVVALDRKLVQTDLPTWFSTAASPTVLASQSVVFAPMPRRPFAVKSVAKEEETDEINSTLFTDSTPNTRTRKRLAAASPEEIPLQTFGFVPIEDASTDDIKPSSLRVDSPLISGKTSVESTVADVVGGFAASASEPYPHAHVVARTKAEIRAADAVAAAATLAAMEADARLFAESDPEFALTLNADPTLTAIIKDLKKRAANAPAPASPVIVVQPTDEHTALGRWCPRRPPSITDPLLVLPSYKFPRVSRRGRNFESLESLIRKLDIDSEDKDGDDLILHPVTDELLPWNILFNLSQHPAVPSPTAGQPASHSKLISTASPQLELTTGTASAEATATAFTSASQADSAHASSSASSAMSALPSSGLLTRPGIVGSPLGRRSSSRLDPLPANPRRVNKRDTQVSEESVETFLKRDTLVDPSNQHVVSNALMALVMAEPNPADVFDGLTSNEGEWINEPVADNFSDAHWDKCASAMQNPWTEEIDMMVFDPSKPLSEEDQLRMFMAEDEEEVEMVTYSQIVYHAGAAPTQPSILGLNMELFLERSEEKLRRSSAPVV